MITATDLELRAGSRILLVRRHPARAAGRPDRPRRPQRRRQDHHPARARRRGRALRRRRSRRTGELGYLPQDPREGDLTVTAKDRVLSARGLDELLREMEKAQIAMAELADDAERDRAVRRYGRARGAVRRPRRLRRGERGGPHLRQPRACPTACSPSRCARSPVASAAGSSWPASCSRPPTAAAAAAERHDAAARRADQPPRRRLDHLAARRSSGSHNGGLVVISHDVELLAAVVNKVWFLDAEPRRGRHLQHGLAALPRRAGDRRERRRRERANAEKKADALTAQADKMRRQGHQGRRRAEHGQAGRAADRRAGADVRRRTRWPRSASPTPAPCGRTPLTAEGLSQELRLAGGLHRRRPRHRPRQPGRRARAQRRRQDDAAAAAGRHGARPTPARSARARAAGRLLRAGARDARHGRARVWANMRHAAPDTAGAAAAHAARRVPVLRRAARPARRHAVRRREDPAGAGRAGVLGGQRAAARRADQQPRPGQPGAGARRAAPLSAARSCWSPTTRARSRRSSPTR